MDKGDWVFLAMGVSFVAFAVFASYMAARQKEQDEEREREKARNAPRRLLRRKVVHQGMVCPKKRLPEPDSLL